MRESNIEQIFHPILDELLQRDPLPWHIRGDGPYDVISDDGRVVAKNLHSTVAEAIVAYVKNRQG